LLILGIHFLQNRILAEVIRPACGWQANWRYVGLKKPKFLTIIPIIGNFEANY
jgi:hypothetical protein